MPNYDESVIETIKDETENYIKLHGSVPTRIVVGKRELSEYKKACKAGVYPEITHKGKTVRVSVSGPFW